MTGEPLSGAPLTVRCACGWETSGTEAEVVATTVDHGRRIHNMEATPEQVLAMAVPQGEPAADVGAAAAEGAAERAAG